MSDVNTSVPISLSPLSLNNLAPVLDVQNTPGAQGFAAAQAALQAAHDGFADVNAVEAQLKHTAITKLVDGVPTRVISHPEFGKAVQARFAKANPAIESARKQLNGVTELLGKKVDEALTDPAANSPQGVAQGAEVRAFVKGLSTEARAEFLTIAINTNDKRTIHALLSAPAYLHGGTAETQAMLRNRVASSWATSEYNQLNACREALKRVDHAHSTLMSRMAKAVEQSRSPDAVAASALKALAGA
jgi:hypothetical protein